MNRSDLSKLFSSYTQSAFRLQRLPRYDVSGEAADFQAYMDGQPVPDRSGSNWLKQMAGNTGAGKSLVNVHVLPPRLTPQ